MASSDDIVWSNEEYALENLLKFPTSKFPLIALVNSGYYGRDDIETLAANQMVRFHSYFMQKRVVAQDQKGRYLSIPSNYPIKFNIIKGKNKRYGKANTLEKLLENNRLPFTVQFEKKTKWKFKVGSQKYSTSDFGVLQLQKTYDAGFLRGNTIHNGVIDPKIMLLPQYVDVTVKLAKGLKSGTELDWENMKTMYSSALTGVKYETVNGTKDIMLYPTNTDNFEMTEGQSYPIYYSQSMLSGMTSMTGMSSRAGDTASILTQRNRANTESTVVYMKRNANLQFNIDKDKLPPGSNIGGIARSNLGGVAGSSVGGIRGINRGHSLSRVPQSEIEKRQMLLAQQQNSQTDEVEYATLPGGRAHPIHRMEVGEAISGPKININLPENSGTIAGTLGTKTDMIYEALPFDNPKAVSEVGSVMYNSEGVPIRRSNSEENLESIYGQRYQRNTASEMGRSRSLRYGVQADADPRIARAKSESELRYYQNNPGSMLGNKSVKFAPTGSNLAINQPLQRSITPPGQPVQRSITPPAQQRNTLPPGQPSAVIQHTSSRPQQGSPTEAPTLPRRRAPAPLPPGQQPDILIVQPDGTSPQGGPRVPGSPGSPGSPGQMMPGSPGQGLPGSPGQHPLSLQQQGMYMSNPELHTNMQQQALQAQSMQQQSTMHQQTMQQTNAQAIQHATMQHQQQMMQQQNSLQHQKLLEQQKVIHNQNLIQQQSLIQHQNMQRQLEQQQHLLIQQKQQQHIQQVQQQQIQLQQQNQTYAGAENIYATIPLPRNMNDPMYPTMNPYQQGRPLLRSQSNVTGSNMNMYTRRAGMDKGMKLANATSKNKSPANSTVGGSQYGTLPNPRLANPNQNIYEQMSSTLPRNVHLHPQTQANGAPVNQNEQYGSAQQLRMSQSNDNVVFRKNAGDQVPIIVATPPGPADPVMPLNDGKIAYKGTIWTRDTIGSNMTPSPATTPAAESGSASSQGSSTNIAAGPTSLNAYSRNVNDGMGYHQSHGQVQYTSPEQLQQQIQQQQQQQMAYSRNVNGGLGYHENNTGEQVQTQHDQQQQQQLAYSRNVNGGLGYHQTNEGEQINEEHQLQQQQQQQQIAYSRNVNGGLGYQQNNTTTATVESNQMPYSRNVNEGQGYLENDTSITVQPDQHQQNQQEQQQIMYSRNVNEGVGYHQSNSNEVNQGTSEQDHVDQSQVMTHESHQQVTQMSTTTYTTGPGFKNQYSVPQSDTNGDIDSLTHRQIAISSSHAPSGELSVETSGHTLLNGVYSGESMTREIPVEFEGGVERRMPASPTRAELGNMTRARITSNRTSRTLVNTGGTRADRVKHQHGGYREEIRHIPGSVEPIVGHRSMLSNENQSDIIKSNGAGLDINANQLNKADDTRSISSHSSLSSESSHNQTSFSPNGNAKITRSSIDYGAEIEPHITYNHSNQDINYDTESEAYNQYSKTVSNTGFSRDKYGRTPSISTMGMNDDSMSVSTIVAAGSRKGSVGPSFIGGFSVAPSEIDIAALQGMNVNREMIMVNDSITVGSSADNKASWETQSNQTEKYMENAKDSIQELDAFLRTQIDSDGRSLSSQSARSSFRWKQFAVQASNDITSF